MKDGNRGKPYGLTAFKNSTMPICTRGKTTFIMPIIKLPTDWRFEPCTKLQREYMENRRIELRWSYTDLIKLCNVYCDNPISDIGQLTKLQASEVLDELIESCRTQKNADT